MYVVHFTGLPLCKKTEDITVSPAVTDVSYSIVPEDAKTAESLNDISAAEMHSSIPVLTMISLTLLLWDLFIILDVYVGHNYYLTTKIITTTCDSKLHLQSLLSYIFIWNRTDCWFFLHNFGKDSFICILLYGNRSKKI